MESELGWPLEQVFRSISERPVAAASLGQVLTRQLGCGPARLPSYMLFDLSLGHAGIQSGASGDRRGSGGQSSETRH